MGKKNQGFAENENNKQLTENIGKNWHNRTNDVVDTDEVQSIVSPVSKNEIGLDLAKLSLYIVGGYLILIIVYMFFMFYNTSKIDLNEINTAIGSTQLTQEDLNLKEIVNAYYEDKERDREFTLEMSKTILINLLLPIITGIVGFIFGTKEKSNVFDE